MNRSAALFTSFLCLISTLGLSQTGKKTTSFELENLGPAVNSPYDDISPIISPDGKTLYFVVDGHPKNTFGGKDTQDIWFSQLGADGKWTPAQHMPAPFNQEIYNSIESVTPDGNTLLIRGAYTKGVYRNVGFSFSNRTADNSWSLPEQINIKQFEKMNRGVYTAAYLSNDGKTLLLAFSEQKKSDHNNLYVSFLEPDKSWSTPKPLTALNTTNSEDAPFLAADGVTMYFSSDRPGGLGNHDIYMTKRLDDTWQSWSAPVNLGPTVNTDDLDSYYSIDATGEFAYLVSGKNSANGLDIVRVRLKEEYRPEPVVLVIGKVFNAKTQEPLASMISYETLPDGKEVGVARSNPSNGDYKIVLPYGKNYGFMAMAEGFISVSDNIDLTNQTAEDLTAKSLTDTTLQDVTILGNVEVERDNPADSDTSGNTRSTTNSNLTTRTTKPEMLVKDTTVTVGKIINRDLYLVPIEVGQVVRINNVFFDFDKAVLRPESYPELDRIGEFLMENAGVAIEISGHTDAMGSDEYNFKLSEARAASVRSYIVSKGISDNRITFKSYGKSMPVADNNTEEGRQMNRRVEFKVLKE
jgi:outer membrane protein OmpA-like peptidoglycan-associated protein